MDTTSDGSTPPSGGGRAKSLVWRLAAILAILAAMVVLAHYLRSPARLERGSSGGASAPGEDLFRKATLEEPHHSAEAQKQATNDLRKIMAGVLMGAADEDGPFQDPANKDPEKRRQFLADRFGLPFDYPRSSAPPDSAPAGAEVLMVFDSPAKNGARMVFLRMPMDIHQALAAIHAQYTAAGWKAPEPIEPQAQPDAGWLLRFSRDGQERVVYARPRASANETLVAVYESPH